MNVMVSIIIPVYNVERYLRRCLDSAANQTLRDIEIICVDDGSTDSSGVICDEYAARDERFIVIHQANMGLSMTRNNALSIAHGKYIAFLDSDDWVESDLCEKLYERAEKTGADLTQFQYRTEGFPKWFASFGPIVPIGERVNLLEKIRLPMIWHTAWSYFYRGEFLRSNKLQFIHGIYFEDIPFVFKAAMMANKIDVYPEILYHYFYNDKGISGERQNNRRWLQHLNSLNWALEAVVSFDPPQNVLSEFYAFKYNALYGLIKRFSPSLKAEYFQMIWNDFNSDDWERICKKNVKIDRTARTYFLTKYYCLTGKPVRSLCYRLQWRFWSVGQKYYLALRKYILNK